MTRFIQSITEIVDSFDVAVVDQWGVLHNGSVPYSHAADGLRMLQEHDKHTVILSNSGKRAAINLQRIADMGFPTDHVSHVVTSGETLRDDLLERRLRINGTTPRTIFPICGKPGDAKNWLGETAEIQISHTCDERVDCIMLMGLPDGSARDLLDDTFDRAVSLKIPLICSNPDKTSPRADGLVISPGAMADRYARMGGEVIWYGKPYLPVYEAVMRCYPEIASPRFLMVGDSLEHDIAGAQHAGFKTAWVRGGIHADAFESIEDTSEIEAITEDLVRHHGVGMPDFSLRFFS